MIISGVQPFTLLDYPDKTACIMFTPGCNFRCGYCHNPEFVLPENIIQLKNSFIPETSFFSFLTKRRGLLDGVVVSGGEPTIAPDLLGFLGRIKALGFLVKLDTNGNRPDVIAKAIDSGCVDYIAMDVKTSSAGYRALVGPGVLPKKILESIQILKNSSVEHEFRTTLIKNVHSDILLNDMVNELRGVKKLYLQYFRPAVTLVPAFASYEPFSDAEMADIRQRFKETVNEVVIRN